MIINRIYEHQNILSLLLVSFLVGLSTYQNPCIYELYSQCLNHPPSSPDLAPSDYHLFPGQKKTIESSPFFVRRGGYCCLGDPVGRTTF